jgi:hypothetical protein
MFKLEQSRKILVIAPTFGGRAMREDLDASKKVYKGWNVVHLGEGQFFKSIIDAKIIAVRDFLTLNLGMYDWVIVMDSADCLFVRDYNEEEILEVLHSFDKGAVFAGENTLFPLKELDGLYVSSSSIKYLNPGVVAMRHDFALELLDYALSLYGKFPYYANIGPNPPSDHPYYHLAYFSKEIGNHIAIDEHGVFAVSTKDVPNRKFKISNNRLFFENSSPFILHCQGNDKFDRKKDFMYKLQLL